MCRVEGSHHLGRKYILGQAGEELDSVEQSGEETADDIICCRVLVVIVLVVVGVTQSVFQTVLQCLFERAPSTAPGHGQR